jgi:pimeloyl-ACP methyl ester carboxylesterase
MEIDGAATPAQIDACAGRTSYNLAMRRAVLPTFADYGLRPRLGIFESSGHYPFLEEGERFACVVEAFLQGT